MMPETPLMLGEPLLLLVKFWYLLVPANLHLPSGRQHNFGVCGPQTD
jgi:hypothetical protein